MATLEAVKEAKLCFADRFDISFEEIGVAGYGPFNYSLIVRVPTEYDFANLPDKVYTDEGVVSVVGRLKGNSLPYWETIH